MKPAPQKIDLLKWANDQNQLDRTTKSTLKELASYADADGCAWAKVVTLAYGVNASERTIQYHLRALQDAGLLRDTGRRHRLEGTTRSVPIYQLAPEGMGAEIAPIGASDGCNQAAPMDRVWVQKSEGMGAIGLHPYRDNGDQESANALSPSASEREAIFKKLVEAAPKAILKFADLDAAKAAFCDLADLGEDVAVLPQALAWMAADQAFKSRKHPPQLHSWLAKGMWRGWVLDEIRQPAEGAHEMRDLPPIVEGAAGDADQAIWAKLTPRLKGALGEAAFGSWLARAYLGARGDLLFVVAATGVARDWIAKHAWQRVEGWWSEMDPARRGLTLVSKNDFERG